MDIKIELFITLQLLIASALGAFIGIERERHGATAGIRTYAAVCLGAALFTAIGTHSVDVTAGARIAANIVTGIGFLGAGIIYKDNTKGITQGLTTASSIWATAAIGVAAAYSMFIIAICSSILIYLLLALHHFEWYIKIKKRWELNKEHKHDDNTTHCNED
ncbi:MAG TPA: MgtC/SapB family protein [Bacteroidia bacterium]|jgi:putative Mg2+ transporter-C (MgtC) family protein|nr:MAG: MgtC/SapB family protein [Bacteroidota bacterium]HLP32735.1 MgtC/SapB family protein [Bacteroidia bacterium]